MGTTAAIVILILVGILLLLLEFLVIPGTTFAAIGGILFIGGGIYLSYESYGTEIGNYVLFSTISFLVLLIIWVLRSGTWKKLMLNNNVEGVVSQTETEGELKIGDSGKTISRLNPMGTVRVNGKSYEAKSYSSFLDENTEIEIVKVELNRVIVKQKK